MWMLLLLPYFSTGSKCKNKLISSINVTTDLQSDVLLPCHFEATLLGSNKTADIAAVWSHRSTPAENLLEIKLQGEVSFWNSRDRRVKPFPKLSESGNFSILLRHVQQSDLGLYRCELHEGINCSIAYQEITLHTGAIGGGVVLLSLLSSSICYVHAKRYKADNSADDTVSQPKPSDCVREEEMVQTGYKADNSADDAVSQPKPSDSVREEETQMYATVKKGRKV
ncbi:hypothetical protein MHYP_G00282700 [Metynnis hypsauchen]